MPSDTPSVPPWKLMQQTRHKGNLLRFTPKYVYPCLGQAAEDGRVDQVKLLLKQGHDPDIALQRGTPLTRAARFFHTEVVQVLLDHGADLMTCGPSDALWMWNEEVGQLGKKLAWTLADVPQEAWDVGHKLVEAHVSRQQAAGEVDVSQFLDTLSQDTPLLVEVKARLQAYANSLVMDHQTPRPPGADRHGRRL